MAQVESKWSVRSLTARYGRTAVSVVVGLTVSSFLDRIGDAVQRMAAARQVLPLLIGVELVLLVIVVAALYVSRQRAGGTSVIQSSLFNLGLSLVLLIGALGPAPTPRIFGIVAIIQVITFAGVVMDTGDALIASLKA
ncbi:MAG TPA: hypothetical protein VNT75_20340 [Symbiobacteriaceae bacterium]|nr:hypothetical protein [Symbiobacteriaceae bacterium]